ncbi:GH25 family lysozyme [Trebonia kvetii]|uniref:GH25 family lysozyme n=1 Tax=Trebonia kvetii TaxID=2480626 RepID=UPI00165275DF|nr:GH25 family lysozyme [Trebonia kvetii]
MDISAFQHAGRAIDWRLLAAEGIRFVGIKVTESTYYTNPFYKADARAASAVGLAMLPYAFANPAAANSTSTAWFAVRAVRTPALRGRSPLDVDLENDPYKKNRDCYGMRGRRMISWISSFTTTVRKLTGGWPIIYATAAWWRECTSDTRGFPHDPLWLALYGAAPSVPAHWARWTFWQNSGGGHVPGVGRVDLDYFQPTGVYPGLFPPSKEKKTGQRAKTGHAKKRHVRKVRHRKVTVATATKHVQLPVHRARTTAVSTSSPGHVVNLPVIQFKSSGPPFFALTR